MPRADTENVSSGIPLVPTLEITGSSASAGKSLRISPTAERTSSSASCKSFSSRNSTTVVDSPVCKALRIFFTPSMDATRLSTFFATSDSSCCGEAPESDTETITTGKSISGNCCTRIARNPCQPPRASRANNNTATSGLRIDQAETFMKLPSDNDNKIRGGAGIPPPPWGRVGVGAAGDPQRDKSKT